MSRRLLLLIAGCAAFWLLVGLPARLVWGNAALVYSGVALVLCLVPAVGTLLWAGWALGQASDRQLTAVLGGTGIRMFVVLIAALALYSWIPYLQEHPGFWIWLAVVYLFTLALEITLLLAGRPASN